MKLHGNAALSWSGRRQLARRVVLEGWTVTAAATASGVSVRCARKWVGRYRLEGECGLLDRSSAPRRVANRTAPERLLEVIAALRRLRMTAAEIAEVLAMPLSTVSAILTRLGMGRLGRLGLEQPLRYERSRPGELVHIDVKKLGRIEGGAGKRMGGEGHSPYNSQRTDRAGKRRNTVGWEYVHIAVDDQRARPRLRRGPRRQSNDRDRFSPPGCRLLPPLRHHRRAAPHRQRLRLPRHHPRARLPPPRDPPPPHPPLPATNKRESRTIHPHPPRRLGLRRDLPLKHQTNPSP